MQNALQVQFTYEVFKSAYDADPGIADIVKNFDETQIEFSDGDKTPTANVKGDNTVANMAKSATRSNSGL
tara:strand:+ start:451 stop:660 length:210 start_codon:yes stop_codon:yes gene_type:complete